jgi:hypothetical protein
MSVLADGYGIGAQDEFYGFVFRHLIVIEDIPSGVGATARFGAFKLSTNKIDAGLLRKWAGEGGPLYVAVAVDIPVVAGRTNETALPGLRRPLGRLGTACGWVGVGKANARG